MAIHKDLTGEKAIHQAAYVQSSDPGAIGAYKDWYDTTSDPAVHKVRNADNDGWLTVGVAGASLADHLSDATDAHDASAISYAGGTGMSATDVEAAVDELATEKANASDLTAHTGDTSDAHDASAISFVPAGTVAATNVQAAIEEVATEAGSGSTGLSDHLADTSDAHDASAISYDSDGTVIATDVQGAIDALGAEVTTALPAHLADTSDAHDASAISYAGGTGMSATDVEAAIDELATEKANDADLTAHTGDTSDAHDASTISIVDSGTYYTSTDVEGALQEIGAGGVGGGGSAFTLPYLAQSGANSWATALGDGNPNPWAFLYESSGGTTAMTPTNIGTTVARCIKFRLPFDLSVSNVYLYAIGSTTGILNVAVYPVGTGSNKLWESGTFNTTANSDVNLTAGTPFSITADTDYWFCVSANAASATAVFRVMNLQTTTYFGADARPWAAALGIPVMAQFTVTAGAFPSTLPAVAGQANGVPLAFLKGTVS